MSGLFFFFALIPDVVKLLRIQIVRKILNQSHNFNLDLTGFGSQKFMFSIG